MAHTYGVTVLQGQQLLASLSAFKMPEKVGTRAFSPNIQATLNKKARALARALRAVSPMTKSRNLNFFGPEENWVEAKGAGGEEGRTTRKWNDKVQVEFSTDAKEGLYWMLYLWSAPESPSCLGAGAQEDIVWPLAEEIKRTKALETDTGIAKNETIEVKDDEEVT